MDWRRIDWRTRLVLLNTCLIMVAIAATFWQQDWQYSLPTPKPAGLTQPAIGQPISLAGGSLGLTSKQPVFLHFFNPDCPCSRFSLEHVRDLARRFSGRVRFVAVLEGEGNDHASAEERPLMQRRLGIESVLDRDGAIGRATGVYATPQAVLLDGSGHLYYRGRSTRPGTARSLKRNLPGWRSSPCWPGERLRRRRPRPPPRMDALDKPAPPRGSRKGPRTRR